MTLILKENRRDNLVNKNESAYTAVLEHGTFMDAARALGIPPGTLKSRVLRHRQDNPRLPNPSSKSREPIRINDNGLRVAQHYLEPESRDVPKKGVKRYLLTCAQNNTCVFDKFWNNLLALKKHYKAELHVSRFVYMKHKLKHLPKPGTEQQSDEDQVWYDERIQPHVSDAPLRLAKGLVWCGNLNVLPTAVRPLSGLDTYTRNESMIIPHARLAMESYPRMQGDPARCGYTTGTVTLRNYIQKKAGQKAEFFHTYGAILVEVDRHGDWFARQINADFNGNFHDLDVLVKDGAVTTGNRLAGIVYGDIHHAALDPEVERVTWDAAQSIINTLRPKYQVVHDVLDFRSRNHHDKHDIHKNYQKHLSGSDDVVTEVSAVLDWLERRAAEAEEWAGKLVVAASNHDDALTKWLREADYRSDPKNAEFFLSMQLKYYQNIRQNVETNAAVKSPLAHAWDDRNADVEFLDIDTSFLIEGTQCALHGHLGPNGSRGSKLNLSKMGQRLNIGHSHSPAIHDGVYQSGCSCSLDLGYNKGPSSWDHAHILIYPNGKRTLVAIKNGKWRA